MLSSHLLIENMCVLNTNYLFSSVFSLGNKNFLVQLRSTSKMVLQKSDSHLGQLFVLFCHLVFNPLSPDGEWRTFWNLIRSVCACAQGFLFLYWRAVWIWGTQDYSSPSTAPYNCMTLGNLFNFSKLHFPHLQNSSNNICLIELLWELSKTMHFKILSIARSTK